MSKSSVFETRARNTNCHLTWIVDNDSSKVFTALARIIDDDSGQRWVVLSNHLVLQMDCYRTDVH